MKRQQLEILIDRLVNRLYGLCYAITFDQAQSAQLLSDAYTVFVLSESKFLTQRTYNSKDKNERAAMNKYLFSSLVKIIIDISNKKTRKSIFYKDSEFEYVDFSHLNLLNRCLLFLKEKNNLDLSELQGIFEIERHKVIELFHNSLFALRKDSVSEQSDSAQTKTKNQISAYVDKTLPSKLIPQIEKSINVTEESFNFYQVKLRDKEFLNSLIPEVKPTNEQHKEIMIVFAEINKITLPKDKLDFLKKTAEFLTSPIIEI